MVRPIKTAETKPLRLKILRPGQTAEKVNFPGDDDPKTVHFGFILNGEIVGIASLFNEPEPKKKDKAGWRLRGMAVDSNLQGKGYGKALVAACIDHIKKNDGEYFWCNARTTAGEFYKSLGFKIISDEFVIPDSGPHWVMKLDLY